jgi:hypothetical protein
MLPISERSVSDGYSFFFMSQDVPPALHSGDVQQWSKLFDGIRYSLMSSGQTFCTCFPQFGPVFPRNSLHVGGELFSPLALSRPNTFTWPLMCICIPRSITVICSKYFACCPLAIVAFETNAQLAEIDRDAFRFCYSLGSISLPASLRILGKYCFGSCKRLSVVTFESGSSLTEIQEDAFLDDCSLQSICLPASLQTIDGSALSQTGITFVTVAEGESFLCVEEDFILRVDGLTIVRYFGSGAGIEIASRIQNLSKFCFGRCHSISSVTFESGSELLHICESAFEDCTSLTSICIPSSVTLLGKSCFSGCSALAELRFEPESKLQSIDEMALSGCVSLEEICVPASIQRVSHGWLGSSSLRRLVFESGESLRQMLDRDQVDLSSCTEICVPSYERELDYPGCIVLVCPNVPGFVAVVVADRLK